MRQGYHLLGRDRILGGKQPSGLDNKFSQPELGTGETCENEG